MGLAVGRGEFPISAEMRTAILVIVAGFAQVLKTVVEGNDGSDFFAHGPAGLASKELCFFRISVRGEFAENLPLGAGFANLARDFGTKNNPALGRRFGPAI